MIHSAKSRVRAILFVVFIALALAPPAAVGQTSPVTVVLEPRVFAALNAHGSGVTYRYAAMAALYLAETRGYPPLMGFYTALRDSRDRGLAFQRAVGIALEEFTTDYKAHLDRLLQ